MTIAEFKERKLQLIADSMKRSDANKLRFDLVNQDIKKRLKLGLDILECEQLRAQLFRRD